MTFIFLSQKFFDDYSGCAEIEYKRDRPYIMLCVKINNRLFAVPMRSSIKHKHVLWTDKENKCGLDFSKAVILLKTSYIDNDRKPYIRPKEFDALRGKEMIVVQRMKQYISAYKKAKKRLDVDRNRILCECSTLQYFEKYL